MFEIIYRYDPSRPAERQLPADAAQARQRLEEGNRAFSNLAPGMPEGSRVIYLNLEDLGVVDSGVPKQLPFAVVLGCSDARVPIELIFDRACNELFVVRVAGNVLGQEHSVASATPWGFALELCQRSCVARRLQPAPLLLSNYARRSWRWPSSWAFHRDRNPVFLRHSFSQDSPRFCLAAGVSVRCLARLGKGLGLGGPRGLA
jgi:hypothetical protein